MNIENYQLYRKHGFVLLGNTHFYSIYSNSKNLDIKVLWVKQDGFSETTTELLISDLIETQQNFKDDINNPHPQFAQMNLALAEKFVEIINDYNDVKEVFDNYASLTVDLESALATKKNKKNKI